MKIKLPELAFIAGTRGMLGVGVGLLIADKLGARRTAVGAVLLALGAATTIPIAIGLLQRRKAASRDDELLTVSY